MDDDMSEVLDEPDLSLVSTENLLDELVARHDAIIFVGTQNITNDMYHYIRKWSGGNIMCLGMAKFIQLRIEQECDSMDQIDEGDEDEDEDE